MPIIASSTELTEVSEKTVLSESIYHVFADGPVVSLNSIQKRLKPPQLLPSSGSTRQKRMSAASETDSIGTENYDGRFQALLDLQNVRVTAVGTFPAPKGNGAVNSYGIESNFLGKENLKTSFL